VSVLVLFDGEPFLLRDMSVFTRIHSGPMEEGWVQRRRGGRSNLLSGGGGSRSEGRR
jgi:hypothetical protein